MVLARAVRSRLVSRLQPWLREDPDVELELGFLSSSGSLKDLLFDCSSLNPLIETSTRLLFKSVRVGEVSFRIAPWSSPILTFEVHGVAVVFAPREPAEDACPIPMQDFVAREMEEVLASMDPEGVVIHELIREAASSVPSGYRLATAFKDALLQRFRVVFHDICFQLELIEGSYTCLLEAKELVVEPQLLHRSSLLSGFVREFFCAGKGRLLGISCCSLKFGFKENNLVNCLAFMKDPSICISLKNSGTPGYHIHIPRAAFGFTPAEIPVIVVMSTVLASKGHKGRRNGRELWKLAAQGIDRLNPHPRGSLVKIFDTALMWIRYVHAYELLLSLVGYCDGVMFKNLADSLSNGGKHVKGVDYQLSAVDAIEKKLPPVAVARARRIARHRALLRSHNSMQPKGCLSVAFLMKFLLLLFISLWKLFYSIFYLVKRMVLFLWNFLYFVHGKDTGSSSNVGLTGYAPSGHLTIIFGELYITLSPSRVSHLPINTNGETNLLSPDFNLLSFWLSIKSSFFTRAKNRTANFALGECLLQSCKRDSQTVCDLEAEEGLPLKEPCRNGNNLQIILRSEPALLSRPERIADDAANSSFSTSSLILKNSLSEMQSDWNVTYGKFKEIMSKHMAHPFALCELKSSSNQNFRSGDHGILKCCLMVGRMFLILDSFSIISSSLLFNQVQHSLHCIGSSQVLPISSVIVDKTTLKIEEQLEFYTNKMKTAMLTMIPKRNLQIAAVIAGPSIQISLQQDGYHSTKRPDDMTRVQGKTCFTVGLNYIKFVAWPASKDILLNSGIELGISRGLPEYLWLKEPRVAVIPEGFRNSAFSSLMQITLNVLLLFEGLAASFENSVQNRKYPVIGPISVSLDSSMCRDSLSSFYTTANALSMALSVVAGGAVSLSTTNELSILFEVLESICSMLFVLIKDTSVDVAYHQELLVKFMASTTGVTLRNNVALRNEDLNRILESSTFITDASFLLKPLNIILKGPRKETATEEINGASSSVNWYQHAISVDLPDLGIGFFFEKLQMEALWEEGLVHMLFKASGIKSVVFRNQSHEGALQDILLSDASESFNQLCQFFLSNCIFGLYAGLNGTYIPSRSFRNAENGSISTSHFVRDMVNRHLVPGDGSEAQSCSSDESVLYTSGPDQDSSCWVKISMEIDNIIVAENHTKNMVSAAQQPGRLELSVSICGEPLVINCEIQGGYIFLETSAVIEFIQCSRAYSMFLSSFFSRICRSMGQSQNFEDTLALGDPMTSLTNQSEGEGTTSDDLSDAYRWQFLSALVMNIRRWSLTFAVTDESGGVQELTIEADANLKLVDFGNNLSFDLSRLAIFSQILNGSTEDHPMISPLPHFHANMPSDVPSDAVPVPVRVLGSVSELSAISGLHSARSLTSHSEISLENAASQFSSNNGHYIVRHLVASIVVEKRNVEIDTRERKAIWVGRGSISGCDLTTTLSDIQMLLDLFAPFSQITSAKIDHDLNRNPVLGNPTQNALEATIPDGAIVAIQDIHQHLYFAIEAVGRKYRLAGVIHYSLVGEKALFRVRYHNRKRWFSSVSQFSLISVHAKNDAGEPLRLNFSSESGFVEVSSNDDRKCALWEAIPYKANSYENDDSLIPYEISARRVFHLVNSKSDCAVAFVDGLPEFVKKPGNPFKIKVFHELPPFHDVGRWTLSHPHGESCNYLDYFGMVDIALKISGFHCLAITIDKITLTILHDVLDANDKFPLIQGHISKISIISQIFSYKYRFLCSFNVAADVFDAQRNMWRETISPFDTSIFFRSRFARNTENSIQGAPARFYFSMKQVNMSLTELSLDVVLFFAEKLNILGPYSVKKSLIFANCCKVENHSGLSLLCQYSIDQEAIVSGRQSTSLVLRSTAPGDQISGKEWVVLVSLFERGQFSTSPLQISLSKSHIFAWRTRITAEGSRTFPGSFLVVELSKKSEEGLSLVVSPLLRIHNETGFSLNLHFKRPHETDSESASVLLRSGDMIEDTRAAFDALSYSGGLKRALMSLSLGNFLLSVRPEIDEIFENTQKPVSVKWSDDLKGEKAVRVYGIFDKLNYRVRKALGAESVKSFFSTVHCPLFVEDVPVSDMYFLIHTMRRDVPVMPPQNVEDTSRTRASPVSYQVQKEIFIFPTIQVSNLVQSEIVVLLTESHPDLSVTEGCNNFVNQATIPCGSSAYLYVNPALIFITVTLTTLNSKCKPVDSGDLVKLLKKQNEVNHFDIDLDFSGGKYHASLRFSRGQQGILEATVYTPYTLHNNTEISFFCFGQNQRVTSWEDANKYTGDLPPDMGVFLPPKSMKSWLLKSNKLHIKWLEGKTSEEFLDLDLISGVTELSLVAESEVGFKRMAKLGVSLGPYVFKLPVPSQLVYFVPRYVVSNESEVSIQVRQCYLEDDIDGVTIEGKKRAVLYVRAGLSKRMESSFFDSMFKKHRNDNEDSLVFIQIRLKDTGSSWSGPVCIASLGRFFLKFREPVLSPIQQLSSNTTSETALTQFAGVHLVEENSSLVMHFHMPPCFALPYRIENCLRSAAISYYQKDSSGPEMLGSGCYVDYVWDDINLPHKLVVQIGGINLLREINIDKVSSWKPFLKARQSRGLPLSLPLEKRTGRQVENAKTHGFDVVNLGYEVYTDGLTRVLRICEFSDSSNEEKILAPSMNIQFRLACLAISFLDIVKQDDNTSDHPRYSTIVIARLVNITMDTVLDDQWKYNYVKVQSINVDEKWLGAPFASMIRGSRQHDTSLNENMLYFVFIHNSSNPRVKQVKYSSVVLQPVDLNLDEETLMRLVKFWRTSLASDTQSTLFYFKHFEIHPIKIRASFLPGNQISNYSSTQEALRSLLHNVIKIPTIKNASVELNGVLLTHALVTTRELGVKCAQHYSWYILRAVYRAKGSPLLPPAFASIFDDSASSSLDVFFDPSDGSINLPGITLGMFRFISSCIKSKGFSGTKRYFGDLGKTVRRAGSNALFAAITEISDSVLKGAETSGVNGLVAGFHQGLLHLAMEPSMIGAAVMGGGPDRKIKLDHSPGIDEQFIEGYLQAMLDVMYKQEYLRVRVNDNQVLLKNLPPSSSLINEIVDQVKTFLVSKGLLNGEASTVSRPIHQFRGEKEWRIGPTVLTLCEHLFVSFAIRLLRNQANNFIVGIRLRYQKGTERKGEAHPEGSQKSHEKLSRVRTVGRFALSGILAYIDGRLCRHIPHPIVRRIVSGFLLSFLEKKDE